MANTQYRRGPQSKINDLETFESFAVEHGDLTQKEMALKWPSPVSRVLIGKALRKIKFTRKKKRIGTGKEMNKQEPHSKKKLGAMLRRDWSM